MGRRSKKRKTHGTVNDRTLYCKGFAEGTEMSVLKDYFQQFGEIEEIKLPEKFSKCVAFITFTNINSCEKILTLEQGHEINDRKLYISPIKSSHLKLPESEVILKEVLAGVERTCDTVTKQIEYFANNLSLTQADVYIRENICHQIYEILRCCYPCCRVFIFGSTLNHFGNKGCDLDLLFEPYPGYFEQVNEAGEFDDNALSDLDTSKMPRREVLYHASTMLKKCRNLSRCMYIEARCPVVNFFHNWSKLSCDLTCSNMFSVHNTDMLRFYSKLDSRLAPLVMIIRNWGKRQQFAVKGSFTSYAISWIVIFYLQNIQPPILPPVEELMLRANESRVVAGYETAFCNNVNAYAPSSNMTPVRLLLHDFFLFYANFDFNFVICPRKGKALLRECFPDLDNKSMKTFICVEDPFERNRNLTGNVHERKFMLFTSSLITAAKIYNPEARSLGFGSWGLLPLFESTNVTEIISCLETPNVLFPESSSKSCVTFLLTFSDKIFNTITGSSKRGKKINNIEFWYETITAAILYIFNNVLLFDASIVDCVIRNPITPKNESKKCCDSNLNDEEEKEKTQQEKTKVCKTEIHKDDEENEETCKEEIEVHEIGTHNDNDEEYDFNDKDQLLDSEMVECQRVKENNEKFKPSLPNINDIANYIVKFEILVTKDTWTERWNFRSFNHKTSSSSSLLQADKNISQLFCDRKLSEVPLYFVCKCYFYHRKQLGFELSCDNDLADFHLLPFLRYFILLKMKELFLEDVNILKSKFLRHELF